MSIEKLYGKVLRENLEGMFRDWTYFTQFPDDDDSVEKLADSFSHPQEAYEWICNDLLMISTIKCDTTKYFYNTWRSRIITYDVLVMCDVDIEKVVEDHGPLKTCVHFQDGEYCNYQVVEYGDKYCMIHGCRDEDEMLEAMVENYVEGLKRI